MFRLWERYKGVNLFRNEAGAYTYLTDRVTLDADGSPRAYHPDDYPTGSDRLANAGFPKGNWDGVLVRDPDHPDRPYIQPTGATQGFFVSRTSLQDLTRPVTSPDRYVNSDMIPYLVFPGKFYGINGTGHFGDLAMVRNVVSGQESFAIVADGGPFEAPLGEMSLRLAAALGGAAPINPATGRGTPIGRFQVVLFPGSASNPAWPRTSADMEAKAKALLAAVGGWPDEGALLSQSDGRSLIDPQARWTLLIVRNLVQENRAGNRRTVGSYQVFHGATAVPGLNGTIAEPTGPGDNTQTGDDNDRRIKAMEYKVSTQVGSLYRTTGYSSVVDVSATPLPGIQLERFPLIPVHTRTN